jgi:Xaa-Pro aminopeptidase
MGIAQLQKLRQKLEEQGIDALLVSQTENRKYLSGFTGSAGWLLISKSNAYLAVDFRYVEQAKEESPGFEILHIKGDLANWLTELVSEAGFKNLGFESHDVSYAIYRQLADKLNANHQQIKLVPTDNIVESVRAVKSAEELEYVTKAVELADSAIEYIRQVIKPGITEKQIAWEIEKWLRGNGSDSIPFDIIVASGTNSALPHAKPSERAVNAGEPIMIDMGARVKGYGSDLSRTFCIGEGTAAFAKVYDIVLGSQLTALATIKSGMNGEQADQLSRVIIEQAGYGAAFGHGLGHGVGLATHESPRVGPRSLDELADGMVFTIEPGIYMPGWGGVRIEDTVMLKNGKIEILTRASKIATI